MYHMEVGCRKACDEKKRGLELSVELCSTSQHSITWWSEGKLEGAGKRGSKCVPHGSQIPESL